MTRIAVISDIHAFHPVPGARRFGEKDPSWVRTVPDQMEESRGPFQSLEALIKAEGLKVDYLLCCGDMGDKADAQGITFAWGWLQSIRTRLGAQFLIGTTGNHDVDSRDQSKTGNPTQTTRALQPPFPIDDDAIRAEYWSDKVALFSSDDLDIVILNTSADHDDEALAQQGHVDDVTLGKLRAAVERASAPKRVLLAHHHPYRHDAIDREDYSALDAGPEVLRILQDNGPWLVVHGHRHYPNLVYAAGGSESPVILASGSFSARLYPELMTRVRNQFHVVDLEAPGFVPGTSGIAGRVRSWEFSLTEGWVQPKSDEGIPDDSGFGYRGSIEDAKQAVAAYIDASQEKFIRLEEIYLVRPELRYMLPIDRRAVIDGLVQDGITTVFPGQHYSLRPSELFLKGQND